MVNPLQARRTAASKAEKQAGGSGRFQGRHVVARQISMKTKEAPRGVQISEQVSTTIGEAFTQAQQTAGAVLGAVRQAPQKARTLQDSAQATIHAVGQITPRQVLGQAAQFGHKASSYVSKAFTHARQAAGSNSFAHLRHNASESWKAMRQKSHQSWTDFKGTTAGKRIVPAMKNMQTLLSNTGKRLTENFNNTSLAQHFSARRESLSNSANRFMEMPLSQLNPFKKKSE